MTEMKVVNRLYSKEVIGQCDWIVKWSTDILQKRWDEVGGVGAK